MSNRDYEINIQEKSSPYYLHIDYGTRNYEINMEFQHFHSFYEIYILFKGKCDHIIEGQLYPLMQYDIVILKPYKLHKSVYHMNQPSERLVINFSPDYINNLLNGDENILNKLLKNDFNVYRFDDNVKGKLIKIFNGMYNCVKSDNKINTLKAYSLFLELICELHSNTNNNIYKPSQQVTSNRLVPIITYIHENFNDSSLNLKMLSSKFFISTFYLSHHFKDVTGFTLTQYIHLTRIKKAQQLLIETNAKTIDISNKCGFGSLSQFNRIFRKLCGCTPTEYKTKSGCQ